MRLDVNAPERVVPAVDESSLCFVENWAGAVSSSYPETRGFTNDQAMDFRESDEYSTYRKFHISRFTINRVLMAQIHILEGDIVEDLSVLFMLAVARDDVFWNTLELG